METWNYLRELGSRQDREALALLFGEGDEPEGLDGKLEGQIVGKLFGIPEAALANPLMKIDRRGAASPSTHARVRD